MTQASVPLSSTYQGQYHRFVLTGTNEIGSTSSLVGYALFAAVPGTPVSGPAPDPTVTDRTRIKADWAVSPDDGGSEVLSYQLEMDDGLGGDFQVLVGGDASEDDYYLKLTFTVFAGISEGVTYRFRYRSVNSVGWSQYSPITYIMAASIPEKPAAPALAAVSSTGITLSLSLAEEDGGSPITGHRIFRDDGADFTANTYGTELTNYDGTSTLYEATISDDALVLGTVYRFVYVATNAYGDSEFSNHLIAGLGSRPSVTAAPARDASSDRYDVESGTVEMMITWDRLDVANDLPILGFQLQMDDGLGNDDRFEIIFDSGSNPLAEQFLVSGLIQTWEYRFQLYARDINGLGQGSAMGAFVACLSPSEQGAPVLVAVSQTSFSVSWLQPGSTGGCPVTTYSLYLSSDQDTSSPTYSLMEGGIAPHVLEWVESPDASLIGKVLRLKVEATNQMGSA